ncbi:phosphoglycerate mutase [Ceraceosorus guamensis]|uniref:Phosphoglycerate mutase n=1 Tax=Ceraceosorus guamensis TaxID=1522189 RepID=A0A316VQH7_9BASI|nr:phosphoglycerate mutase [Ceraceosorus guamensis]PWN39580.1 phosphoglycerate mutase [Ceraceosorus guamensis]
MHAPALACPALPCPALPCPWYMACCRVCPRRCVGTLVLTRHGQSEWNKLNLFTGWKDPALTELGKQEATKGGQELVKGGYTDFDLAFTSDLSRAQETLKIILGEIKQEGIPTKKDQALNERDYGELTGLNKDDARKKWGEDQIQKQPPTALHVAHTLSHLTSRSGGESLKLTADRVLPYYEKEIKPAVLSGKKVLVAAHGNSLRAMIMSLENMTGEQIVNTELATGVPIVYKIDESGKVLEKKILDL